MVKPLPLTSDLLNQTCARFTPNKSGQRSGPTYYRGCWHVVSRPFLVSYRHCELSTHTFFSFLQQSFYDPKTFFTHAALLGQGCPHCRRFLLLPPAGVWAVSQSSVADHPLRSAMYRRLGGPLPHQLANTTQVHLLVMQLHLSSI